MQNNLSSSKPKYKFYATLLDAFQWYLKDDSEEAFQSFLDKVNRVPFTSEAADKGTAFNELIDKLVKCGHTHDLDNSDPYEHNGFEFKAHVVHHFVEQYKNHTPQMYVEATLPTSKGDVLLYGYIDEMFLGSATDIKTTKSYDFPKFLHNWQHIVYPYCLIQNGVTEDAASFFRYHVTDFNNIYKEDYVFNKQRDTLRLVNICEQIIDFLEAKKHLITDTKIFGGEKVIESNLVEA